MVRLLLWAGILWAAVGLVFGVGFSRGRDKSADTFFLVYYQYDTDNTIVYRVLPATKRIQQLAYLTGINIEWLSISADGAWLA